MPLKTGHGPKNLAWILGMMLGWLLLASVQTGCDGSDEAGLGTAMQQYLTAIRDGDVAGFEDLLPNAGRFRFCSYGQTSGNLLAAENFSSNEVRHNLAQRGGLYFALFGGTDSYRYRDRILQAPLPSWTHHFGVFRWHQGTAKSYVKWSREADGWKIIEVGDSVP